MGGGENPFSPRHFFIFYFFYFFIFLNSLVFFFIFSDHQNLKIGYPLNELEYCDEDGGLGRGAADEGLGNAVAPNFEKIGGG